MTPQPLRGVTISPPETLPEMRDMWSIMTVTVS
jgi:hypothetical protein